MIIDDDEWGAMAELWRAPDSNRDAYAASTVTLTRRLWRERWRARLRLTGAIAVIPLILALALSGRLSMTMTVATLAFATIGVGMTFWSQSDPALWAAPPHDALAGEMRRAQQRLRWGLAGLAISMAAIPYIAFVLYRRGTTDDLGILVSAVILIVAGTAIYGRAISRSRLRLRTLASRAAELDD